MATSSKTQGEPTGRRRQDRRREITGILLMALGLFAVLSLLSLHTGDGRMMGPGGAAVASALYSLVGLSAYLLVAWMLLASVRCFRGRPMIDNLGEGAGTLLLAGAVPVLLHLPFAHTGLAQHGPGGLLGEVLGEVAAGFIGSAGAALAATAMLAVALLLVTDVSLQEVTAVLAWALRHARRGIVAGALAAWRVTRAAFPEKDDRGDVKEEAAHDMPVVVEAAARGAEGENEDGDEDEDEDGKKVSERDGVPVGREGELSEGIRVGEAKTVSDAIADERSAMAAIVAEVAAAEEVAPVPVAAEAQDTDETPKESAAAAALDAIEAAAGEGPIIVESASRARMREQVEQGQEHEPAQAQAAGEGPGFIKLSDGAYQLPATELLEYVPPAGHDTDKQALYDMAERLEQAMANYGVRGKVKEIHMGPVVTMYEFAPAPGTRTGKVANLEKDLAMALEAQAVRIVAPIPGKAVVGVEVPNRARETVYLKEILEDSCFTGASSKLQVGLGKDIKGAPVSVNLAKMPHLLVAGTTGSGKSVAVNGMITSILYSASPEEVRFIMVDPKMLELSIYEGIPHLLLPVVTDPKKANLALRWAVDEMERRYELLAKTGVRDISAYNAKIERAQQAGSGVPAPASSSPSKKIRVVIDGPDGSEQEVDLEADAEITIGDAPDDPLGVGGLRPAEPSAGGHGDPPRVPDDDVPAPRKLPYVVIVIDEFADLMMVAPKDVETSVARIAQKARAAGLHLILATQRPSVDVITGLIKANFPSRIALQVASKIDSRTILDQPGAETLLGNGDMLFSDRGTKLRRIHGAFLSDDEVHRVVDFLKKQAKPVYDMDILKPRDEEGEEGGAPADDFQDDLYDQAIAIVCETRQASVSYIQRRLQIGYNRAARMVEQMERDGVVGPANGAKPREVLAPPGEYLQQAG
jgi:S-DNA-T family DNA segregation ATPase FtsK/SpoIIIE